MKLIRTSKIFGDETALYNVVGYKATTVEGFIAEVLREFTREWGYIEVKQSKCEYSNGKLLSKLPSNLLHETIHSIKGHGGWSRMDYNIQII